jgi:peptidoglycan/LPS O-acetylase OafA/YrhL
MFQLNKPILATTCSLLALLFGVLLTASLHYSPEHQSIQAFVSLFPATFLFAALGGILGAISYPSSRDSRSLAGCLIGGGVLLAFVIVSLLPAV